MARDRKRAKQRRERRARRGARPSSASAPVRADVPGALDHASADVDEFDAALVRGADGVPDRGRSPPADTDGAPADPKSCPRPKSRPRPRPRETSARTRSRSSQGRAPAGAVTRTPEQASGAPQRGGNRAIGFLRASWAELHRVQWPDRRQVAQATAVVLGFVAIAGAYLGLADYVAKEIVEFIL